MAGLEFLYETRDPRGKPVRAFRDRAADRLIVFHDGVPRVTALNSGNPPPLAEAVATANEAMAELDAASRAIGLDDATRTRLLADVAGIARKVRR